MAAHSGRNEACAVGIIVAAVLALSFAATAPTSAANDHLIVPGQRIGPIKLGDNINDAVMAFGSPFEAGDASSGKPIPIAWVSATRTNGQTVIGVMATPECANTRTFKGPPCRILQVMVNDPEYATVEGLHVGVLESQVRGALGEPNRVVSETARVSHSLRYASGILFWVNDAPDPQSQRVEYIYVRPRNCLTDLPCT